MPQELRYIQYPSCTQRWVGNEIFPLIWIINKFWLFLTQLDLNSFYLCRFGILIFKNPTTLFVQTEVRIAATLSWPLLRCAGWDTSRFVTY